MQWDQLYARKPADDYEDPADVAAIREARANMGDYKLKSSPDYVVPDELRMNTEKARYRLIQLREKVCSVIMTFCNCIRRMLLFKLCNKLITNMHIMNVLNANVYVTAVRVALRVQPESARAARPQVGAHR